jgi:pyridoxamine 5'-phosphate oxidase-like protein
MGKLYNEITPELADWLKQQRLFFVATAPLAAEGLVNCSPKGLDSFRILGPREVAYQDLTGSGIETVAHLRENGRIVFMFCAFTGPPRIVRLHGTGEVIIPGSPDYEKLQPLFPDNSSARAIVHVRLVRISTSCGYGVPRYDYAGERDTLVRWAESKGADRLKQYRRENNARSLDGLPGLEPDNGSHAA